MPLSREFVLNKFSKPTCIGICGVATAGKDTFFAVFKEYLKEHGIVVQRFALADKLKDELDPFLIKTCGISAWTTDSKEKTLIRPMLVAYGGIKRRMTTGTHWTNQIEQPLREAMAKGIVPVVTDIRYAEYEKDEVYWIKNFGGKLAYITRYQESNGQRTFVQPPNEDERRNDPKLREAADAVIEWDTVQNPTVDNLADHIERFITAI